MRRQFRKQLAEAEYYVWVAWRPTENQRLDEWFDIDWVEFVSNHVVSRIISNSELTAKHIGKVGKNIWWNQ